MTTNLQALNIRSPINSLDAYLQYVNRIPLLTDEEERELSLRLRDQQDLTAAKRMILSHLRYVIRVAKGYLGYGLPLADLIQEGNIGLMKAVRRFNPDVGVRLVTFAMHWIKAEIHEYILRNWRIVKIATTKAQRKLFFNLRQAKKHLNWMNPDEINDLAHDLGVKAETVREMEMRLAMSDASFDGHAETDDDYSVAPAAYLEDHRYDPANQIDTTDNLLRADALHNALHLLDERSQAIIRARWLDDSKLTLQDLAAQYNISAERVRQLEKNAFNKLKLALKDSNSEH